MSRSKPRLSVIDEAIRCVEEDRNTYSCIALSNAAYYLDNAHQQRYYEQYELFIRSLFPNRLPRWWNSEYSEQSRIERIKYMKLFRQACIDAAVR